MSILIKRRKSYHWVRAIWVTGMLIVGGISLYQVISDFANQWYWLILATLYTITVNETFTHRICAHKMFEVDTDKWLYKILTWMSSVDQSHGPVRSIALWHLSHHRYSDQGEYDPSNAKVFWYGEGLALPWGFLKNKNFPPDQRETIEHSYQQFKNIIDDPFTKFCERYDLEISISTLTILFLLAPVFLFKVLLMGRLLMTIGMACAGIAHLQGIPGTYKNINTLDTAYNNLYVHYLFLGIFSGLLQNNHHSRPNAVNLRYRWWEIDSSAPIAYSLKWFLAKK